MAYLVQYHIKDKDNYLVEKEKKCSDFQEANSFAKSISSKEILVGKPVIIEVD